MPIQFLNLQGAGGTAVPYERRNGLHTMASVASNPQDALRLKRYEEQWRFYSGIQWSFQREDGEPLVTANFCRRIVDKKASFLVGKGMIIEVPESVEEITKPILEEVWKYNRKDRLLLEMAVTGGVTGDVFILTTYQGPTDQQKAINPYTQGRIRIRLLGSHQVFPTFNPLNHEELLHVRIITEVINQNPTAQHGGNRIPSPFSAGNITVQQRSKYIEDIYPNKILQGWEGDAREEIANDLGEIGLVHITNQPFPNEYYGLSDLDGIIDIQREYNEKLTDVSDIINYHSSPITIISGARAKQLEKGKNALWSGLPKDAKVYNLEMTGDLPASNKYLDIIKSNMMELANLPEGSFGKDMAISNTSGAALAIKFQPLLEATERKLPSYRSGLEKVNYFILRYHQLMTGESYPVDLCKHCGGRIVEIRRTGSDGSAQTERKCFLINPQTLDFMPPEEVQLNWKRKFSYGVETRMLPYGAVKKDFLKEGGSYWDPQPAVDLEAKAVKDAERDLKLQEWQRGEQARQESEQAANDETARGKPMAEPKTELNAEGKEVPSKAAPKEMGMRQQDEVSKPAEPARTPPKELLPDPKDSVVPEQLSAHDIDIPEEPVTVPVKAMTWNPSTRQFDTKDLGELTIVPSGCDRPRYLNPYENEVSFKSALPRNKQEQSNLYAQWQENGWVSRRWSQEALNEDINIKQVNKELADDIPFLLAMKGEADPATQVAQTAGIQDGQVESGNSPMNGAPPPATPGPGRGNKIAPGDNLASPPPNAAPGGRM